MSSSKIFDVVIIGGGPSGLSCAIEAQRLGLSHLIIEKGSFTDGIRRFPKNLTFFSTPELLSIGGVPFPCTVQRPSRLEVLAYYRSVIKHYALNQKLYTRVTGAARGADGLFELQVESGEIYRGKNLVIATGYFDLFNALAVPGETLPHVHRYYEEAAPYVGCDVVIVGGGNTAAETALELFRNDARVTIVHRKAEMKGSVKYWLKPDIENRIREGSIRAFFESAVVEILPGTIRIRSLRDQSEQTLRADFVLPLIGYRPDIQFLQALGAKVDAQTLVPELNAETLETSIPGLFVAGSATTGIETGKIFIENSRFHGGMILKPISERLHSVAPQLKAVR